MPWLVDLFVDLFMDRVAAESSRAGRPSAPRRRGPGLAWHDSPDLLYST